MTVKEKSKVKEAYRIFDFMEEQVWLHMLKDRNDTSHIYDGDMAKQHVERILDEYIPIFVKLKDCIIEGYEQILKKLS